MNFNKWVRYSFSKSKIKEGSAPGETMGIGSGDGSWAWVGKWGEKQGWFACLDLVPHADIGDESFGPWKLGI